MSNTPKEALQKIQKAKEKNLKHLKLTDLTEFPKEVLELENLEYLDLDNNKLKTIPEDIHKLKNIQLIELQNNLLEDVPDAGGLGLDYSQYLKFKDKISLNNIAGIFLKKERDQLSGLEVIEWINKELPLLPNLISFSLEGYEIDISFISKYINLKILAMTKCKLTDITPIQGLQNLENLD